MGAHANQAAHITNRWFTLKLTGIPQNVMRNADMLLPQPNKQCLSRLHDDALGNSCPTL